VLKDRLYISAPKSQGRRSAQTAIWRIGEALVRLLAPIMTFTCEEVWQHSAQHRRRREESVHLAFPSAGRITGEVKPSPDSKQSDWTTLRSVRDDVLKALEEARNNKLIGGGLEAQVSLPLPIRVLGAEAHEAQLRYLFIVSAVEADRRRGQRHERRFGEVKKADGQKCERCWNYSTHVGEDKDYPTVCERCSAVLKEIEIA
jgi:isoleucyl-tRNA synthetase